MEATLPTRGESLALELADGADPRDLAPQGDDAEQLRLTLLHDLYAFCWFVLQAKYILYPPVHDPVCRFVERWGEEGHKRLMIQLPRGIGKTTVVTIGNTLRLIFEDPNRTVVIFNEREDNTSKWIKAIRNIVSGNSLVHALFPHVLPPGIVPGDTRSMPRTWKWNDYELEFQRSAIGLPQSSITGMGIGAASTGGHWTHVVDDDIIGLKAQESREVMENAKEWADRSIFLESPAMFGNNMVVCTPYTHDDVYVHMRRRRKYLLFRQGAIEDGKSIWEDKMPLATLLDLQKSKPEDFASQLMCRPMAGADTSFQGSWVRPVIYHAPPEEEPILAYPEACYDATRTETGDAPPTSVPLYQLEKWVLLDPAPTEAIDRRKEPGSRNGMVVVGIDPWGRRYLLDTWAGRPDPLDVIRQIIAMCKQWSVHNVGIEEVNFSRLYRHWLAEEAKRASVTIYAKPLATKGREKDARIAAMIAPMREGWWRVVMENCQEWYQELVQFPYAATRDLLDAWAYSQDVLRRPVSMAERLASDWERRIAESTKDPVTGY